MRTERRGLVFARVEKAKHVFWANCSKTSIFWLGGWNGSKSTQNTRFLWKYFVDVNLQFFLERLAIGTVRVFTDFLTRLRRDALGNQVSR